MAPVRMDKHLVIGSAFRDKSSTQLAALPYVQQRQQVELQSKSGHALDA